MEPGNIQCYDPILVRCAAPDILEFGISRLTVMTLFCQINITFSNFFDVTFCASQHAPSIL